MATTNAAVNQTQAPEAPKVVNLSLKDQIEQELVRRRKEIVLGAFQKIWAEWQSLDQLLAVLNDENIRPYLGEIKREDFLGGAGMRARGPNRVKPPEDVLKSLAEAVFVEARKAPETGVGKDLLLGAMGDKRGVAEEWWPQIKEILGDRLETVGHGRSTTYRSKR